MLRLGCNYCVFIYTKSPPVKFIGIFLSLLLFTLKQGFTQTNNFAPLGATWYYSDIYNIDYDYTMYVTGYNKVESIADTNIDGINCRELKFSFVNPTGGLESALMF